MPRGAAAKRPSRQEKGASLIEVMAALLVISMGLLGMARISSAAISHNKSAQVRLVGQSLAQLYSERARLNVYGYDLGGYDILLNADIDDAQAMEPDAMDLRAATLVAGEDRREFMTLVASSLPGGRALVSSAHSPSGREMDIWLMWMDPQMDTAATLTASTHANCPTFVDIEQLAGASCMYFRVGL